jgi:DNA-binding Lrp family transcriptional regulator
MPIATAAAISRGDFHGVTVWLQHPHFAEAPPLQLAYRIENVLIHEFSHILTSKYFVGSSGPPRGRLPAVMLGDARLEHHTKPIEIVAYSTQHLHAIKNFLDRHAEIGGREGFEKARADLLGAMAGAPTEESLPPHIWRKHLPKIYKKHARDAYKFITQYEPKNLKSRSLRRAYYRNPEIFDESFDALSGSILPFEEAQEIARHEAPLAGITTSTQYRSPERKAWRKKHGLPAGPARIWKGNKSYPRPGFSWEYFLGKTDDPVSPEQFIQELLKFIASKNDCITTNDAKEFWKTSKGTAQRRLARYSRKGILRKDGTVVDAEYCLPTAPTRLEKLIDFIESRGGCVVAADLMEFYERNRPTTLSKIKPYIDGGKIRQEGKYVDSIFCLPHIPTRLEEFLFFVSSQGGCVARPLARDFWDLSEPGTLSRLKKFEAEGYLKRKKGARRGRAGGIPDDWCLTSKARSVLKKMGMGELRRGYHRNPYIDRAHIVHEGSGQTYCGTPIDEVKYFLTLHEVWDRLDAALEPPINWLCIRCGNRMPTRPNYRRLRRYHRNPEIFDVDDFDEPDNEIYKLEKIAEACTPNKCNFPRYKDAVKYLQNHPNAKIVPDLIDALHPSFPITSFRAHLRKWHPQFCRLKTDKQVKVENLCRRFPNQVLSMKDIANQEDVPLKQVHNWCKKIKRPTAMISFPELSYQHQKSGVTSAPPVYLEEWGSRPPSRLIEQVKKACRTSKMSKKAIADFFGVSYDYVWRWCQRIKREYDQYQFWYDQGLSDVKIAAKVGKSDHTVRGWRKRQTPPLPPNRRKSTV